MKIETGFAYFNFSLIYFWGDNWGEERGHKVMTSGDN